MSSIHIYDFARGEFSIAQWLERRTSILEGYGFNSRWRIQKRIVLSNSTKDRFVHSFQNNIALVSFHTEFKHMKVRQSKWLKDVLR